MTVDISNASTVPIRRYDTDSDGFSRHLRWPEIRRKVSKVQQWTQAAPDRLSRSRRYSEERRSQHAASFLYLGGLWVVAPSNVEQVKPDFA